MQPAGEVRRVEGRSTGPRRRRRWWWSLCAPLPLVVSACAAAPSRAPSPPGLATVSSVTDGDTLRVSISGASASVRLIGIDTPETHGPGGLRECFGDEASRRTATLLPPGTRVRLVADAEGRDRYGRLLAYVYRAADGLFVNGALAEGGFADVLSIEPNIAHRAELATAVAAARSANRGLWAACGGADTPVLRVAPLPSPP